MTTHNWVVITLMLGDDLYPKWVMATTNVGLKEWVATIDQKGVMTTPKIGHGYTKSGSWLHQSGQWFTPKEDEGLRRKMAMTQSCSVTSHVVRQSGSISLSFTNSGSPARNQDVWPVKSNNTITLHCPRENVQWHKYAHGEQMTLEIPNTDHHS